MNTSYSKKRHILESNEMLETRFLSDQSLLSESGPTGLLNGRKYVINPDHTISINNSQGKPQKIKMSGTKKTPFGIDLNFDINIKDITPTSTGYKFTTVKNNERTYDQNFVSQIIKFVDTNNPTEIPTQSDNAILKLQKV